MAEIREFEVGDAAAVAELLGELRRDFVATPASVLHREAKLSGRKRRQTWVALEGRSIAGVATGEFRHWGGPANIARLWAGVRPEHRRRGIGSALYERALAHVVAGGAVRLSTEVDDDGAGMRFARERGYEPSEREIISALDAAAADLSELDPLLARATADELRVMTLEELRTRSRDWYEFTGAAGGLPPAGDPSTTITYDDHVREVQNAPDLDFAGSAVLLDAGDRIVALALLSVDRDSGRAENDWTATLPELRGRGLARLAKLATIAWARGHGIREIVTGNMADNVAMLAVNRRIGYRELFVRQDLERDA